jgi:hypothetical protein
MKKFIVAALTALVAASASAANARDEPSREAVEAFYHQLSQDAKKQRFSLREAANHLVSSIWWSEKLQLLCPSYFYVNARLLLTKHWNAEETNAPI